MKIDYTQLDYKQIPSSIINDAIYADGGVHSRVIAAIEEIGPTKAGKVVGVKKQAIEYFLNYRKPKLKTILKYAEKFGV